MTFEISKSFRFEAAHHLPKVPQGHKCRRPHGHSYVVIVTLRSGRLDEYDFVSDYANLNPVKTWIDENLDHRNLNDLLYNPTAENLAVLLYDHFVKLVPFVYSVTVKETENTTATYWRVL